MSFKHQIKEYVSFTRGERKGIIVLLFIILIVTLINVFSDSLIPKNKVDFTSFKKEVILFEGSLIQNGTSALSGSEKFLFNPNHISESDWYRLGLKKKQIQTIQNYLAKGGRFTIKSDLKKIYGISEEEYLALEPYIDLPNYIDNRDPFNGGENYNPENKIRSEKFFFNPNTIGDEEWIRLGFTEKQVQVIRNYIDAGGRFYKKEDLKKMYVVSEEKYNELKEFVVIDEDINKTIDGDGSLIDEKGKIPIDINSISQDEIIKLGGNWKFYGQRIVKFRNLLGGFYSKEQLLEVYGLKKEIYDEISSMIEIDLAKIKKLNINFIELEELARHPYLSEEEAEKIILYRNNKGALKNINELYYNNIINSKTYEKVKNYLSVQ